MEVGGAGTLGQSLVAVRPGGQINLLGVLSGASSDFNVIPVFMKQVRIQGLLVGSRELFEQMNRAISAHELRPAIGKVFPFERTREALEYLDGGSHFGKVCVRID